MKTDIILMSPPEQAILCEAGDRPNLGLLYLASALKEKNHSVLISDLNHEDYYNLNKKIKYSNPQFIGITTTTPYFHWFTNYAKHLKHNYPEIKLIAGGPHATADPTSLEETFDHIVVGEGERAIVDLIEGKIKDKIIRYPYEQNLDSLPIPLRGLLPLDERYGLMQEGQKTMTMLTSRSCDYDCFFCTKNILGPNLRCHSIDRVISEVKELKDKFGYSSVYFTDDCFISHNKNRVKEFADKLISEKINISYRCTARANCIETDILKSLKKSGCRSLSLGLEHMDDNVLSKINKGNTIKDNENAIKLIKQERIKIRGSFILNLPGATKETMYKSLQFAIDNKIDYCDWYLLQAYPGTALWNFPEKFNCELLNKDYGFSFQTSGKTNVNINSCNLKEALNIHKDINIKWREFKGCNVPWELK